MAKLELILSDEENEVNLDIETYEDNGEVCCNLLAPEFLINDKEALALLIESTVACLEGRAEGIDIEVLAPKSPKYEDTLDVLITAQAFLEAQLEAEEQAQKV